MKSLLQLLALFFIILEANATPSVIPKPAPLPTFYASLVPYIQPGPDQGETNTCWFVASTGAMELLLNKKDNIRRPKIGGKNDLAESFIMHQKDFYDENIEHFIQEVVLRFNHGEAVHISKWPFNAFLNEGYTDYSVWNVHPDFFNLPRIKVPQIKTKLLFSKGRKWATEVLEESDIIAMKRALIETKSPLIVNYNDDGYWHVVLIVGYDDRKKGVCYELEKEQCNEKGSFYVRDSDGKKFERRAYNWFLHKGNAAATVELK